MVDFEQMLDNLMQVERAGFNPYTQAYSAALEPSNDPSGTQTPFNGESGLKEISRVPMTDATTTNIASTPQTAQPTPQKTQQVPFEQAYNDAWYEFGSLQADLVDKFAEKYPNIPIYEIARETKDIENWSNKELDKYYADLEKKYGKVFLDPEKDDVDDRWYEIKDILRKGDTTIADKKAVVSTRGDKEPKGKEKISYRNLLERRKYPGQSEPYQYLYEKEDRENMRWKSRQDFVDWRDSLSEEEKEKYFKAEK